jgi:predicted membrane GTPase involved in stress response
LLRDKCKVESPPKSIRLRKKFLDAGERKRKRKRKRNEKAKVTEAV